MASANIEAILPLNAVQDGVLYHTLYAPGSSLYVQQYVATLAGPLDAARFESAWDVVVARHQALRSFITWDEREQPLQIVRGSVQPEWLHEDWSGESSDGQKALLDAFLARDRRRGFTLDVAPLMRFALLRLGPEDHRFVWTHHHIVVDGWSLGIVLNEVFAVYERGDAGGMPEPVPLRSYSAWYRQQDWSNSEAHWRSVTGQGEAGTWLGVEAPSTRPWADRQVETIFRLSSDLSARLRALAQDAGVSLSSVFRAGWGILLHRYTGESEVLFGAAVAGRAPDLPGSLDMVGMFINSIPVRVGVDPDATVLSLLRSVQADQMAGQEYESTPLSRIQSWSGLDHDDTLFHSLLVFENIPQEMPGADGVRVTAARYLQESNYPISILVMPSESIDLHLLYDPDRYTEKAISRILAQLERTLGSMAEDSNRSLRSVESLTDADLAQAAPPPDPPDPGLTPPVSVDELILEGVRSADPGRVAIVGAGEPVTAADLDERSALIAGRLRAGGIGRGDVVGVAAPRTAATVAAMLGVLRSGAAYVPIDPSVPAERIAFMLRDAGASHFVDVGTTTLPDGLERVVIGSAGESDADATTLDDATEVRGDDLAYVMYTSGSTGLPKGVEVTHRNLVSSTLARRPVYDSGPDAFLVVSPLFFDSSVAGLYSTLLEGGTIVLPEPDAEQDINHLADLIERHNVTHTLMVPSLYALLLELVPVAKLSSLDTVMVAGEACPASLVEAHHRLLPDVRLFNEYGPTEATVWCTVAELGPDDTTEPVTIGTAIPGTCVYIVDPLLRPAPPGAFGELCVAGPGVAAGYLGRPDLTEDRFVTLPLPSGEAVRAYRTGDLARRRHDGLLELAGRRDHQVKIRGQRIELGEIEAVLRSHPGVREAVVIAHAEHGDQPTAVVAYVEPGTADPGELRRLAADRLPRVMVPGVIVALDALPRGATGKIDRRALEAREVAQATLPGSAPAEPETDAERALAEIWAAVLGVDAVGVHDNFFDLGGDSITTIRIIARAHEAGLSITPRQFFDHPTVAELAAAIATG